MIDTNKVGMNELTGQFELSDYMEGKADEAPETSEGYDEHGNLMDYEPRERAADPDDGAEAAPRTAEGWLKRFEAADAARLEKDADRLQRLAGEILAIEEQTRGVVISAALAVGKRLIEAKGLVPEGRFGEWLEANVRYSERKAQDMMRLYEEYGREGAIPESIAALDYSKAVALLSAPEEAREALAEKAQEEGLSVRQLQRQIRDMKIERAKAQMTIENLEGKNAGLLDEIARLDEHERDYDAAIVREREAAAQADARAKSAEASAEALRKLHSDAEDRAAASAQRASDAVNRANQMAKELAAEKAETARLKAALEARDAEAKTVETVEVIPADVKRELEELRRQLAEAQAAPQTSAPAGPTAVDRFKWFYANQMKPVFAGALALLKEVAQEDGKAAGAFATAISAGCKRLIEQLGESEG